MSDRKITLDPKDVESLRLLVKKEEARFDEADPSDEELELMERALEARLRKLAAKQSENPPASREIEQNWQAIQEKMQQTNRRGDTREEEARVLPFKEQRVQALVWMGAFAAAALTLLVVVPRLHQENEAGLPQFVEKGSTPAFAADCELDARAKDGSVEVSISDDRMGFLGPAGTTVQLSIRCSHEGFLQVSVGGQAGIRNLAITSGITQDVTQAETAFQPVIRENAPLVLSFVLTEQALPEQAALPTSEAEAERLQSSKVLWFDTVELKGKLK